MELSASQQERYARHLLLDGFEGAGQERLCSARVHVAGEGEAALWAARYLAASGVGALVVQTEAIASQCCLLNGDVSVSLAPAPLALLLDAREGDALHGARLALTAFRLIGAQP